jgi:hypothetical protein
VIFEGAVKLLAVVGGEVTGGNVFVLGDSIQMNSHAALFRRRIDRENPQRLAILA